MSKRLAFIVTAAFVAAAALGCGKDEQTASEAATPVITNRLQLPPEIISNLGVTFAKVKRGKVGERLTVPGVLSTPKDQTYTLNAPTQGRLKLVKSLWDEVVKGEVVAEILSPDLVAIQEELVAASTVQEHARSESDSTLPGSKARAAQAARTVKQKLKTLSVLTGFSEEALLEKQPSGQPRWAGLSTVSISAPSAGSIVEIHAANGDFLQTGAPVAKVIDTSTLIFQGRLVQSNLHKLRRTMPATIVPEGAREGVESTARILPVTDSQSRLLLVEAELPNPDRKVPDGFTATARLLIKEGTNEEAIVHPDTIVQDGLEHIVFKRDPEKPEFVIRTPVELGTRAEGEVEILSGVMEGDEVVRDGVQQLKQTGLGKAPAGGHFHADGTWHEGDK